MVVFSETLREDVVVVVVVMSAVRLMEVKNNIEINGTGAICSAVNDSSQHYIQLMTSVTYDITTKPTSVSPQSSERVWSGSVLWCLCPDEML